MLWGTAATKDSISWTHVDDHGMATVVTVAAGLKYWVLGVPRRKKGKQESGSDLGSIRAFGKGWSPSSACETLWDHEGILLRPGDTL